METTNQNNNTLLVSLIPLPEGSNLRNLAFQSSVLSGHFKKKIAVAWKIFTKQHFSATFTIS